MITKETLEDLFDTHISDHCEQGMTADNLNHCAHYVSHELGYEFGYQFGYQCGNQTDSAGEGSTIRVQEVFARCPEVGLWADKPAALKKCLAFITKKTNVDLKRRVMSNVPRKHIGIFCDGHIYHYSNSRDKVVKQTPDQFSRHYSGTGYAVFYGKFVTV